MTTDPKKTLVNFRLPPELVEAVDDAARRAGLNRTEWVTTTLTMAARAEGERTARAVAARVPAAQLPNQRVAIEGCAHPKGYRVWGDAGLCCLLCQTVLERRRQGA